MQKKRTKILAIVLAVLMVLGSIGIIASGLLASGSSISDLHRQINEARGQLGGLEAQSSSLNSEIDALRGTLAALRAEEGAYLEELNILQEQLDLLKERIEITETQIEIYQAMIADKELRLEEAIVREEEQLALYKARLRAMEERGPIRYIQIILSARSFSDLITRVSDMGEITAHDQRLAESLALYREAVREYRDSLEADRVELEILIAQLEAERAELEIEAAALQELIDEISAKIEAREIEQAALYAEQARIDALIDSITRNVESLSAEVQRQIEEQRVNNPVIVNPSIPVGGMFLWPSDTTFHISSGFGPRSSPGGIGSTFHRGIDIPAPHGSNVLASADGVVVHSKFNGGFGNYILINHGGGYFTVYAHQSQNIVSAGQVVVQGQVIGFVGSTGNSTGPHIHFEIHAPGRGPVDPMLYFS